MGLFCQGDNSLKFRFAISGVAACVLFAAPAHAATYYLVSSWFANGDQMCKYDNGTVLNVGGNHCPTTIQG